MLALPLDDNTRRSKKPAFYLSTTITIRVEMTPLITQESHSDYQHTNIDSFQFNNNHDATTNPWICLPTTSKCSPIPLCLWTGRYEHRLCLWACLRSWCSPSFLAGCGTLFELGNATKPINHIVWIERKSDQPCMRRQYNSPPFELQNWAIRSQITCIHERQHLLPHWWPCQTREASQH